MTTSFRADLNIEDDKNAETPKVESFRNWYLIVTGNDILFSALVIRKNLWQRETRLTSFLRAAISLTYPIYFRKNNQHIKRFQFFF